MTIYDETDRYLIGERMKEEDGFWYEDDDGPDEDWYRSYQSHDDFMDEDPDDLGYYYQEYCAMLDAMNPIHHWLYVHWEDLRCRWSTWKWEHWTLARLTEQDDTEIPF